MKKLITLAWLSILLTGIAALFWYNDLIYQLPTPVPSDYKAVNKGEHINLHGKFNIENNKPVLLHFFNPDCPCSRFNLMHFKTLVKEYQHQVNFAIVVINNDRYTEQQVRDKFDLDLPVSFDSSLARICGVYSTPQAVILDNSHRLYYRGNYNKNRYCTDKKTSYAQIALHALFTNQNNTFFDRYALTAYGCQLPKCSKN